MRGIKLSLAAIMVLMVFVVALAGCGRKGLININGEKIAKDEFYANLERVPVQSMKAGKPVTIPAGRYVVEKMITEKLITQLAQKEGVEPKEAQVDKKLKYLIKRTGGNFKAQLAQMGVSEQEWKRQMMLQQSVVNLITKKTVVSVADMRANYDAECKKMPSKFVRPKASRISVIISKTPERIQKAYRLLQDGQDFGSVALQLSEDKTTAPYQGVVGWLSMDMAVVPMPIRTAADGTGVGKYSKPFFVRDRGDKAWVIVKVDQKRHEMKESFDNVKDLIREEIAVQRADKKPFNKALQDFIASSKITVNAERYKNIPEMMKKSATMPENLQPGAAGAQPASATTKPK